MDGFFRLDKGRTAADSVQEDGDLPAGLCRNKLRQPAHVVLPDNATRGAKQLDVHRAPTALTTGCFPPYSGRRVRLSGRRPARTTYGPRKTGGRPPVTSGRRPRTGRRPPRTSHRPPCSNRRPPRPGCRRPRSSRRHPRGIVFDQAVAAYTTTIRARVDASRIGWRRDRRSPPRRTRPLRQHQAMAAARVDQTNAAQHLVERVPFKDQNIHCKRYNQVMAALGNHCRQRRAHGIGGERSPEYRQCCGSWTAVWQACHRQHVADGRHIAVECESRT